MKVFFRLISLLKPQLPLMMLGALLSVITVLANISLLAVSGWFITLMAIAGSTGITVNYFTPAAIVRFLAIVRTAGRYAERMLTHRATFNTLAYLRHYFYQQLEPLLPYYRVDLRTSDLLSRLQQDVDNLDNFYLRILLPITVALITVPILYFALAYFSSVAALMVLSSLLIVSLVFPAMSYLLSLDLAQEKSYLATRLAEELVDGIGAIKTLLVYQEGISYQNSIITATGQYYRVCQRLIHINSAFNAITFLFIHLSALACLWLLLPQIATGEIDYKSLVAVVLLVLVSFETVASMPLAMQLLPQCLASARRLFNIIDKEKPIEIGSETAQHGDIHFDNLTFTYPEQKKASVVDLNLLIKAGEKVAIIGASGAGKSTLVNLLMGFWPTGESLQRKRLNTPLNSGSTQQNNGKIMIAGCDLSLIQPDLLRQHIALMSQQGHLFDATIGDNLRLAKDGVTLDEMRNACRLVNLDEFINHLPEGFNTWLGANGTRLSGGQIQRLQIAQLLLRSARVLILDEPTKGLDRRNEEEIMRNILCHVKQRNQSLVVITHKPLMLEKMDNIVVMEQGKIIAQGNHQQLYTGNDYYQKLLNFF